MFKVNLASLKEIFNAKDPEILRNPKKAISRATMLTKAVGSSTCCITSLSNEKDDKFLYTANIGDSSYILYRYINDKYTQQYKCPELCHSFNFPYQIGTGGDNPSLAFEHKEAIKKGDLIIMGTDGLWDNVFPSFILEYINKTLKNGDILNSITLDKMVKEIAKVANYLSLERTYLSPFAARARSCGNECFSEFGGKPDDITVLIAQINDDL